MMHAQPHRRRSSLSGRVAILAFVFLASGCEQSSGPAAAAPTVVDPRESFAKVVEQLKLTFVGFSENLSSSNVRFSYIVHEVIGQVNEPNDADSGSLTAQVSVRTSTRYTPLGLPVEEPRPAASAAERDTTVASETPTTGTSDDDTEERARAKRVVQAEVEEVKERVRVAVDEQLRERGGDRTDVYEFAYENGRWVLTSEEISDPARSTILSALKHQ